MHTASRLLSICAVFLAAASPCFARVWHVLPGGGDAPTVQAAIDSAVAGDSVELAPGLYTWTGQAATDSTMLRHKSGVTLRGGAGAAFTILDAESQGHVIDASNTISAVVEGLSITNGNANINNRRYGGGLVSVGSRHLRVSDCIVRHNRTSSGGGAGIACVDSGTVIADCLVDSNVVTSGTFPYGGGGIVITDGRVERCTVRANTIPPTKGGARRGGGIEAVRATISDCLIEGNWCYSKGGGVMLWSKSILRRCVLLNNFASDEGGAIRATSGTVEDCIVAGNQGGVLSMIPAASRLSMTRCTIYGNDGNGVVPGLFRFATDSIVTITACIVAQNTGPFCVGTRVTWDCNDLFENGPDSLCGTDAGGNFALDPELCSSDPIAAVDFTLRADSPCAPGNHPQGFDCGRIGAADVRCTIAGFDVPRVSRARLQAWPNPTSGSVQIDLWLPISSATSLALFDVRGRCVRALAPGAAVGATTLFWDGLDRGGQRVAPGVYFVQLRTTHGIEQRKIVVVRSATGRRE